MSGRSAKSTTESALVKYDAIYDDACRAIAACRTVDEAKTIRDKADAWAFLARRAKNREMEADAVEIRLRATRCLAELIQAQKERVGFSRGAAAGGRKDGPRG